MVNCNDDKINNNNKINKTKNKVRKKNLVIGNL